MVPPCNLLSRSTTARHSNALPPTCYCGQNNDEAWHSWNPNAKQRPFGEDLAAGQSIMTSGRNYIFFHHIAFCCLAQQGRQLQASAYQVYSTLPCPTCMSSLKPWVSLAVDNEWPKYASGRNIIPSLYSFQQLKPTTVDVTKPKMLDLSDAVFWTFSLLLSCIPLPNDVYVKVICWHLLEARVTWRTTRKHVCKWTWCVRYLIPRGFLVLVILSFKTISFSHETNAGQLSVFVQIVEVL